MGFQGVIGMENEKTEKIVSKLSLYGFVAPADVVIATLCDADRRLNGYRALLTIEECAELAACSR